MSRGSSSSPPCGGDDPASCRRQAPQNKRERKEKLQGCSQYVPHPLPNCSDSDGSFNCGACLPYICHHAHCCVHQRAMRAKSMRLIDGEAKENIFGEISPIHPIYRVYRWVPIKKSTGQKISCEFGLPPQNRANPARNVFPRRPTRLKTPQTLKSPPNFLFPHLHLLRRRLARPHSAGAGRRRPCADCRAPMQLGLLLLTFIP